jgi:hypothetical protein
VPDAAPPSQLPPPAPVAPADQSDADENWEGYWNSVADTRRLGTARDTTLAVHVLSDSALPLSALHSSCAGLTGQGASLGAVVAALSRDAQERSARCERTDREMTVCELTLSRTGNGGDESSAVFFFASRGGQIVPESVRCLLVR